MGDVSNLREQFFWDSVDITEQADAEQDATEACLWEHDQLVASFVKRDDDPAVWDLDATELNGDIWSAAEGKTWGTAREALTFAREWLATEG